MDCYNVSENDQIESFLQIQTAEEENIKQNLQILQLPSYRHSNYLKNTEKKQTQEILTY